MSDLSNSQIEAIYDFLTLKRDGDDFLCPVCGWSIWSGRKIGNDERAGGPAITSTYVQLICKNCKHVVWFTDKILDGI